MHSSHRDPIDDCVHCGFCLPACPTYLLWAEEADSPRGRIHLMRVDRDGRGVSNAAFVEHIDACLGCMACVTACPSGVRYDLLLPGARAKAENRADRSVSDRVFRALIFGLFPHPGRLRVLAWPLALYQRSGLQRLVRASGILNLLPPRLRAMEQLTPAVDIAALTRTMPAKVAARGPVRRRVGLLTGCVQRVFFARVNEATLRVLAAEGCEVVVPPEQGCCGALSMHSGRPEEAAEYAKRIIDVFERHEVDTIVINAAGCGSAMKEYSLLLADDPRYTARARAFADKCKDVSELLADLEPRATRHELPMRVAYHDACHLQHAQGIRSAPRRLLQSIPGVEIHEIAESEICCGSAGIYNLLHPATGRELRDRKVGHIVRTNADVIVSSNPGCILQIGNGLAEAGNETPIVHLVELLDSSIRGDGEHSYDRL